MNHSHDQAALRNSSGLLFNLTRDGGRWGQLKPKNGADAIPFHDVSNFHDDPRVAELIDEFTIMKLVTRPLLKDMKSSVPYEITGMREAALKLMGILERSPRAHSVFVCSSVIGVVLISDAA
jgi:hypothetical protein